MKVILTVALLLASPAHAICRQALALGLDVSGSVDALEYRLQLDGLAAAFDDPNVAQAVLGHPGAPIRLVVFEWSVPGTERIIIPWTEITHPSDLAQIQSELRQTDRAEVGTSTGLGPALLFGTQLLSEQSRCWVRTLDLSGDGKANIGIAPQAIEMSPDWLIVNGLVIGADDPRPGDARQVQIGELVAYYRAHVIRGSDAFVETALGFTEFEAAMERKLLRELAVLAIGRL